MSEEVIRVCTVSNANRIRLNELLDVEAIDVEDGSLIVFRFNELRRIWEVTRVLDRQKIISEQY